MFDTVEGEGFRRQFQGAEQVRRELPLIGKIMNGDDGGRPRFFAIVEIGGGKARLPIVRMDDVRRKLGYETPADGGGDLSKRGEAKGVIGPIGAARRDIGVSRTVIKVGRIENEKIEICRLGAQNAGAASK